MEIGDNLIQMNLKKLEEVINGEGLHESFHHLEIHGVCIDSKNMKEGNVFVPIIRVKDGHDYVKEAMDNGAVASLWKKSYGTPPKGVPIIFVDDTLFDLQQLAQFYRREINVKVIGITGSNGKTTVKDIIEGILRSTYRVHKTKGNFNSQIGLPLTILEMKRDTEFLILEMGMSEKGCRIIERFTWNSFRGNCPKVDVKNQNLFKNACILQSEEIEYSVNIKSDDQEKYMMQRSTESNRLLERLRYRMMERHL